jgi:hypothetical protein
MAADGGITLVHENCDGWAGQVQRVLTDLLARGYDGGFSIEPHMAAIIHEGKRGNPQETYNLYLEYGQWAQRPCSTKPAKHRPQNYPECSPCARHLT